MKVHLQVCQGRVNLGDLYDYSFQELGKRFIFWFLCDHKSQKQICRSLSFSSGSQLLEDPPFDWLSIVCEDCCFSIYTNFKGW